MAVDIIIGHLGRPRSTHTAPMPVPMGCVYAQIITKPSRAGFAVSRSELVEPEAATYVCRGMAVPCSKSLERTRYKYQYNIPHLLRVVLGKHLPS